MRFTFVTLFENIVKPYFEDSILSRAIKENIFSIDFVNPRDYATDKHKKVDDYQAGGGAGLLIKPEPLSRALEQIKSDSPSAYFIFATPAGKPFKQIDAKRLAKYEHVVFVNGRYEGIDERIIEQYADELFSIGDYILTGGELPSMCMCDAISRNIPKVLGNAESLDIESYENNLLEAPAFTKPNSFKGSDIIKEYLKGNHGNILTLKSRLSVCKTNYFRPDLYKKIKTKGKLNEK
ncbi:MAG TPA: tRNA (guanosine(37)-N1)-methyltransferase TrmD [Campylobacterales bacterium]|nr:tRNA (guanosine(37)-N1)-methyltransferase TrmD [Campylobacterales bacterium]